MKGLIYNMAKITYKRRDELENDIKHLEECLNRTNIQIERLIINNKALKLKLDNINKLADNCSGDDSDCKFLFRELVKILDEK